MLIAASIDNQETTSTQKPIKTIRLRGVCVSIFANPAKKGGRDSVVHKVVVERSFKDGGDWRPTSSFGRDDLPVVALVLQQAWEFILKTETSHSKEEAE